MWTRQESRQARGTLPALMRRNFSCALITYVRLFPILIFLLYRSIITCSTVAFCFCLEDHACTSPVCVWVEWGRKIIEGHVSATLLSGWIQQFYLKGAPKFLFYSRSAVGLWRSWHPEHLGSGFLSRPAFSTMPCRAVCLKHDTPKHGSQQSHVSSSHLAAEQLSTNSFLPQQRTASYTCTISCTGHVLRDERCFGP